MTGKLRIKRTGEAVGIMLLVLVLGYIAIRPWYLRWGATHEEVNAAMPGDLPAGPRWTRAITIEGSPQDVWPWLVQWGQGRGGWYSYDWLENLFGLDIHSADQILAQYQNPSLGDDICMGKGFCVSKIAFIEPYRVFGWGATAEDGSTIWSFTFALSAGENNTTPLVMRESFDRYWMPAAAVQALAIPDGIMGQKALHSVKERVEGRTTSWLTTGFEIGAWLAAFFMGVLAVFQMAVRPKGMRSMLVVAGTAAVLLVITFLFPPLWLRMLLDVLLLGLLVWMNRLEPLKRA